MAQRHESQCPLRISPPRRPCAGFGTDDDALTDILCFRTKPQIARLNEAYKVRYVIER